MGERRDVIGVAKPTAVITVGLSCYVGICPVCDTSTPVVSDRRTAKQAAETCCPPSPSRDKEQP